MERNLTLVIENGKESGLIWTNDWSHEPLVEKLTLWA